MDEYKKQQENYTREIIINDLEISIIEKALLVFCRLHNNKDEIGHYSDLINGFQFDEEEEKKLDQLHERFFKLDNE